MRGLILRMFSRCLVWITSSQLCELVLDAWLATDKLNGFQKTQSIEGCLLDLDHFVYKKIDLRKLNLHLHAL